MDDYTFLILAKLKADRLKLAGELRATLPQPEPQAGRNNRREYLRHTRIVPRVPQWREQS